MKNFKTIFLTLAVILLFCCCSNKATKTYGEETKNSSQNENTNIAVTETAKTMIQKSRNLTMRL